MCMMPCEECQRDKSMIYGRNDAAWEGMHDLEQEDLRQEIKQACPNTADSCLICMKLFELHTARTGGCN